MNNYPEIKRIQSFDETDMSKPFVIETEMQKWPAMEKWTFDYFKENFGDIPIHVFRSNSDLNFRKEHTTMTFGEYIDYILTTEDENPYYLVDWFVYQNLPEIVNDYKTPKTFVSWFSYLPYKLMPKFLS